MSDDKPTRIHPNFNPHLQPEEGAIKEGPVTTVPLTKDGKAGVVQYFKNGMYCIKIHDPDHQLSIGMDETDEDVIYRFQAKEGMN